MLTGGISIKEVLPVANYFGLEGLVSLLQNEKDHVKETMNVIQRTLREMLHVLDDIERELRRPRS